MKIEILQNKKFYKNYKELCNTLDEPIKTGNSKVSQLKEWERHFHFEKEGNKFHIIEIYKIPLPPNNNITKYIPIIEKLILHIILTNGSNNVLYINKSKLYEMLKMINKTYTNMKYHKMQLSHKYDISKETIQDFYNTSDDLLERNVEAALKSLERQSLIKYNNVFSVCELVPENVHSNIAIIPEIDTYGDIQNNVHMNTVSKIIRKHRRATKEETSLILRLQRDRLLDLNCNDMKDIFIKGLIHEFYNPIKEYLLNNYSIEFYYTSYELIFNMDHVNEAYQDFNLYMLDEESYYLSSSLLNINIGDKLEHMAKNRHNKAKSELIPSIRSNEQYLKDIKLLIEKLVHNK